MTENPFVPIFGGKPYMLFGRDDIIPLFEDALTNRGSLYRAMFVTGRRGMGKTTLLAHLADMARKQGWCVIDTLSISAADDIVDKLVEFDEVSQVVDPQLGIQVLGSGITLKGGSIVKTKRYSKNDLPEALFQACHKAKHGICVILDEIQKVSLEDMSIICAAIQSSSKRGSEIILLAAGLPGSYEKLAEAKDSNATYVQRAHNEVLGVLTFDETLDGYRRVFDDIDEMHIGDETLRYLTNLTFGHPYLVQLLGYFTFKSAKEKIEASKRHSIGKAVFTITDDLIDLAQRQVLPIYEERVLEMALNRIRGRSLDMMKAVAKCFDIEAGFARSEDVYKELNVKGQQVSTTRRRLLEYDLIYAFEDNPRRLSFTLPYMCQYLLKTQKKESNKANARLAEWKVC